MSPLRAVFTVSSREPDQEQRRVILAGGTHRAPEGFGLSVDRPGAAAVGVFVVGQCVQKRRGRGGFARSRRPEADGKLTELERTVAGAARAARRQFGVGEHLQTDGPRRDAIGNDGLEHVGVLERLARHEHGAVGGDRCLGGGGAREPRGHERCPRGLHPRAGGTLFPQDEPQPLVLLLLADKPPAVGRPAVRRHAQPAPAFRHRLPRRLLARVDRQRHPCGLVGRRRHLGHVAMHVVEPPGVRRVAPDNRERGMAIGPGVVGVRKQSGVMRRRLNERSVARLPLRRALP